LEAAKKKLAVAESEISVLKKQLDDTSKQLVQVKEREKQHAEVEKSKQHQLSRLKLKPLKKRSSSPSPSSSCSDASADSDRSDSPPSQRHGKRKRNSQVDTPQPDIKDTIGQMFKSLRTELMDAFSAKLPSPAPKESNITNSSSSDTLSTQTFQDYFFSKIHRLAVRYP
jgi:chromosome segregation ATPase